MRPEAIKAAISVVSMHIHRGMMACSQACFSCMINAWSLCSAEQGDDIVFQRSIVPSGAGADATYSSQYRIDQRVVTWEAYKDKLGTFGILVKARNFLVFQVCIANRAR